MFHLGIILQNLMCIKIVEYKILEQALDKSIQNDFIALKPNKLMFFCIVQLLFSWLRPESGRPDACSFIV